MQSLRMLRLVILRHAKSARPAGIDDFDRPLCERGEADALRIGSWLSGQGVAPALVLCSPARRARDTAERVMPVIGSNAEISFDPALYLAEASILLQKLRAAAAVTPLMLVGHNPGLHDLGKALLGRRQAGDLAVAAEEFARKLPTTGVALIDFRIRAWSSVRTGSGAMAGFARPKDLTSDGNDGRA